MQTYLRRVAFTGSLGRHRLCAPQGLRGRQMHQNVPKGRFQGTPASMPEISATTTGKLLLVVGGALIKRPEKGGRSLLLLAQRPPGKANAGLWELPGGKLDEGETPEGALVRELREELGLEVELKALEPLSFVSYPYPTFHLLMPVYAIHSWAGTPRGAEGQQIAFVNADEMPYVQVSPRTNLRISPQPVVRVQGKGLLNSTAPGGGEASASSPPPKRRGRPPGSKTSRPPAPSEPVAGQGEAPVKKKGHQSRRGGASQEEEAPVKKRGRPRKATTAGTEGRSKETEGDTGQGQGQSAPLPVTHQPVPPQTELPKDQPQASAGPAAHQPVPQQRTSPRKQPPTPPSATAAKEQARAPALLAKDHPEPPLPDSAPQKQPHAPVLETKQTSLPPPASAITTPKPAGASTGTAAAAAHNKQASMRDKPSSMDRSGGGSLLRGQQPAQQRKAQDTKGQAQATGAALAPIQPRRKTVKKRKGLPPSTSAPLPSPPRPPPSPAAHIVRPASPAWEAADKEVYAPTIRPTIDPTRRLLRKAAPCGHVRDATQDLASALHAGPHYNPLGLPRAELEQRLRDAGLLVATPAAGEEGGGHNQLREDGYWVARRGVLQWVPVRH